MALEYVRKTKPRAVLAVACDKELAEGVEGVASAFASGGAIPEIVVVPLTKDGCIDTEVDLSFALQKIGLGCGVESSPTRWLAV